MQTVRVFSGHLGDERGTRQSSRASREVRLDPVWQPVLSSSLLEGSWGWLHLRAYILGCVYTFFLETVFLLKCQINVLITAQSNILEPSDTSEVKVENVRIV